MHKIIVLKMQKSVLKMSLKCVKNMSVKKRQNCVKKIILLKMKKTVLKNNHGKKLSG